jgi:alpha-galactosidase
MQLADYAGPGHWNDPDYILIGWYGLAAKQGEAQQAPHSPDETYSYMSLWSLMAAPLFFSGDMERLDEFTLNVLCNAEIIGINQDALGRQARVIRRTPGDLVLAKELEDGSMAVGLFNLTRQELRLAATWKELGLSGKRRARDPWRQVDLRPVDGSVEATVAPHGVAVFVLGR